MQEVREEQARRKAEGKTAKYKSLKKEGAAQVIQTLLLRKIERKLKTTKLAAQLVLTLLLRKI